LTSPEPFVGEGDEVLHQVQERRRREHPAYQHLKLRQSRRGKRAAVDRLPWRVVLELAAKGTEPRLGAGGDDAHSAEGEQRRDLRRVGAQLVPCATERRALLPRHLQLDQPEWEPVDEHEHVRAAGLVVFLHAHLVDDHEVIALGILEIDEPGDVMAEVAPLVPALEWYALCDQLVHAPVLGHYVRALGTPYSRDDLVRCFPREFGIQPGDRSAQAPLEKNIPVRRTLAP
jgi:hypothetical protein